MTRRRIAGQQQLVRLPFRILMLALTTCFVRTNGANNGRCSLRLRRHGTTIAIASSRTAFVASTTLRPAAAAAARFAILTSTTARYSSDRADDGDDDAFRCIATADADKNADNKAPAVAIAAAVETSSNDDEGGYVPPWSLPNLKTPSSSSKRFRQHVNPLSRRYQMEASLPPDWPASAYDDVDLPLYLDIGCGKGGFLLELAGRRLRQGRRADEGISIDDDDDVVEVRDDRYMNITKTEHRDRTSDWLPDEMNYLGLEIRPGVSQYAQARVERRGLGGSLSFVGCNANVDLDRMLTLYRGGAGEGSEESSRRRRRPAFVSIQFPDPHFKKAHSKRRVVTAALVTTLAKFANEGDVVFLQSDIRDALEAMREKFVEEESDGPMYFDERPHADGETTVGDDKGDSMTGEQEGEEREYGMENPLGIPTEREVSVLKKGLPVFRTMFVRNAVGYALP